MRSHANTLFVTTQGAYVTRDHQTLRVKIDGKVRLTVPLHHLESVVCFGRVTVSPAVGYVHVDRPGRPSLALDLMEEFRTLVADRLVLALVNRRQVQAGGFATDPAGGVRMDDKTRRSLLVAYQERKREEVTHPLLGEAVPVGLLPHLQARLLARTLRGDLDGYPALVLK